MSSDPTPGDEAANQLFVRLFQAVVALAAATVVASGAIALSGFAALGDAKESAVLLDGYSSMIEIGLTGIRFGALPLAVAVIAQATFRSVVAPMILGGGGNQHAGMFAGILLLFLAGGSTSLLPIYGIQALGVINDVARYYLVCDAQVEKEGEGQKQRIIIEDCERQIAEAEARTKAWFERPTVPQRFHEWIKRNIVLILTGVLAFFVALVLVRWRGLFLHKVPFCREPGNRDNNESMSTAPPPAVEKEETASPHREAAPGVLTEVVREAELYLSAQLQTAIAADQRASTFVGVVVTAAVAAAGGAATVALGREPISVAGGAGLASAALCLVIAAVLAALSLRPSRWDFPGNWPSEWKNDIEAGRPLDLCLFDMADHYDDMLSKNDVVMKKAAKLFSAAIFCAIAALPLAVVVAAIHPLLGFGGGAGGLGLGGG